MKQGREKSRRGLSLGGGGCVGVCDHLKPSQEVAGSGRVGGEKGGPGSQGQSGRSVDTPFLPLHSRAFSPESRRFMAEEWKWWKMEERRAQSLAKVSAHSRRAEFLGRDWAWLPPTEETPPGAAGWLLSGV